LAQPASFNDILPPSAAGRIFPPYQHSLHLLLVSSSFTTLPPFFSGLKVFLTFNTMQFGCRVSQRWSIVRLLRPSKSSPFSFVILFSPYFPPPRQLANKVPSSRDFQNARFLGRFSLPGFFLNEEKISLELTITFPPDFPMIFFFRRACFKTSL